MPYVVPATVLGKNGSVAPSERLVLGGIGIGNRGTYDLGCFLHEPDVRFAAVCDVKAGRRNAVKRMADSKYGNKDCKTYIDFRELLGRGDMLFLPPGSPKLARAQGGFVSDEEVHRVVQYLKSQPFVDSTRMGVFGWSYGGFMTMLLVTKTDLFAAAVLPLTRP